MAASSTSKATMAANKATIRSTAVRGRATRSMARVATAMFTARASITRDMVRFPEHSMPLTSNTDSLGPQASTRDKAFKDNKPHSSNKHRLPDRLPLSLSDRQTLPLHLPSPRLSLPL